MATTTTTEDRVRALRRGRGRPAQLSKIVTAGVAASTVLGLTAAFGWSAGTDTTPEPPAPVANLGSFADAGGQPASVNPVPPAPPGVIPVAIPAAAPAPRQADATTSGSR